MKPISIQLYTVRTVVAERGMPSVLKEIAEIGYPAVEDLKAGTYTTVRLNW